MLALLAARWRRGRAPLGGTFLQFWAEHLKWEAERWERLFGYLAALRAKELVVQWSGYDGIDYGPLVEKVLELAEEGGMRVRVGLRHESGWWKDVEESPSAALRRLEARAAEVDRRWCASVGRRKAFAGWYLPEEIDDVHWRGREAGEGLGETVRAVRRKVGRLAASGFASGAAEPGELAAFWRGLARRSGLEEVLFQDGIGAGKTSLETWPGYAAALARGLGRRFRVVVETFEASPGPGEFRAAPAGVERVLEQCRVAAKYSRKAALAFSMPEYYTPEGGAVAAARYHEYLSRMDRI